MPWSKIACGDAVVPPSLRSGVITQREQTHILRAAQSRPGRLGLRDHVHRFDVDVDPGGDIGTDIDVGVVLLDLDGDVDRRLGVVEGAVPAAGAEQQRGRENDSDTRDAFHPILPQYFTMRGVMKIRSSSCRLKVPLFLNRLPKIGIL